MSSIAGDIDRYAASRHESSSGGDIQFSFDSMAENEITLRLKELDLNTVTPIEALNLLYELKKKVQE